MLIPLVNVLHQMHEAYATLFGSDSELCANSGSSAMHHFCIAMQFLHQIQNEILTVLYLNECGAN